MKNPKTPNLLLKTRAKVSSSILVLYQLAKESKDLNLWSMWWFLKEYFFILVWHKLLTKIVGITFFSSYNYLSYPIITCNISYDNTKRRQKLLLQFWRQLKRLSTWQVEMELLFGKSLFFSVLLYFLKEREGGIWPDIVLWSLLGLDEVITNMILDDKHHKLRVKYHVILFHPCTFLVELNNVAFGFCPNLEKVNFKYIFQNL